MPRETGLTIASYAFSSCGSKRNRLTIKLRVNHAALYQDSRGHAGIVIVILSNAVLCFHTPLARPRTITEMDLMAQDLKQLPQSSRAPGYDGMVWQDCNLLVCIFCRCVELSDVLDNSSFVQVPVPNSAAFGLSQQRVLAANGLGMP